jgi:hypothetical protein
MKPASLFEIDRKNREELKEIIAYLNVIGLKYYSETKGTLEERKRQFEGFINLFDFLSRSSQARKEFEKQIKPEFKETLKRFEEAIK